MFVVAGVRDEHADVVQHGGGLHEEAVVVVQRQRQLRAAVLAARAARLHAPQNLLHESEGENEVEKLGHCVPSRKRA